MLPNHARQEPPRHLWLKQHQGHHNLPRKDVGKVAIAPTILCKHACLDDAECASVRSPRWRPRGLRTGAVALSVRWNLGNGRSYVCRCPANATTHQEIPRAPLKTVGGTSRSSITVVTSCTQSASESSSSTLLRAWMAPRSCVSVIYPSVRQIANLLSSPSFGRQKVHNRDNDMSDSRSPTEEIWQSGGKQVLDVILFARPCVEFIHKG
ncbi:hypothetical protein OG21DRAFT_1056106 [Imleria badia]|nr:hypothetical protein OG21DRAFT_1056106 [Imleria badia]